MKGVKSERRGRERVRGVAGRLAEIAIFGALLRSCPPPYIEYGYGRRSSQDHPNLTICAHSTVQRQRRRIFHITRLYQPGDMPAAPATIGCHKPAQLNEVPRPKRPQGQPTGSHAYGGHFFSAWTNSFSSCTLPFHVLSLRKGRLGPDDRTAKIRGKDLFAFRN
jgi:hypothetical protein